MKTWSSATVGGLCVIATAVLIGTGFNSKGEIPGQFSQATNSPYAALQNPTLTNIPGAFHTISQIVASPAPALSVPEISTANALIGGTFYTLQNNWPPLPGDFFPNLPVYELDVTNGIFLIDDRSVDYVALQQQAEAEAATNGSESFGLRANFQAIDTNSLWLEVPTNALPGSNLFNVVIHKTVTGNYYDVLTKTDLLLPAWTVETTVAGAAGDSTPVTLSQNGRTNLFVWAREAIIPIYTQPMAQEVLAGDTVTFTVIAGGSGLTYQWTLNGTNIYGATGNSYTIYNVQPGDAGDYACIVTSAAGTVVSQAATLTVDAGTGDPNSMVTLGQRQDYTFRSGINYYIGSTVQLYGNTTIEGGTVVKFDYTQLYPSLQVLGTLTCKGSPYNPSILTTIDDDSFGEAWSYGAPQPYVTGVPFLDLSAATTLSVANVRFRFADEALSTPAGGQVDVWDSQFFQCDAAIINEFGGRDCLHNVLIAGCFDGVAAFTNNFALTAEHLTADVTNLWDSSIAPYFVGLTNSIILGSVGSASAYAAPNTSIAPDPSNFQITGAGNYYLAPGSSLHQSGTANVSPYLLNEFHGKTTYAPLAFPALMAESGSLTLYPQAPRYTNGAPDIGYYYDALDYTVAFLTSQGSITVEPGTAIGLRNEPSATLGQYTWWGFDLRENSSFVSHGTPTKPITFADVQLVQEQFEYPCCATFVPDFEGATNQTAPVMDFRFCNFYAGIGWYHVWAGMDANADYLASYNSAVNWAMQDCNLHGGQISLGEPDNGNFYGIPYNTFYGSGVVAWNNNLFENVQLNLQPTYDWYDGTINVDLAFQARNNLFRNGGTFTLAPVPASAGNWTFTDNLFDHAEFYQDTALALDFDYNGYWSLKSPFNSYDATQLQTTTTGDGTTDGLNEVVLSYAPAYQSGTFGNYYLSTLNPLYGSGSQTAGAAGLAQYTTSIYQTKEGATHQVNIGLHYVAATNGVPLDSDGDGVPDYVEDVNGNGIVDANETDPNNAMTDGITPDAYSTVYDDIDLSGNGLVGRIKKALGMNPLDGSNPLMATQVITGEEPEIATFEVPISYNALTNIGTLRLLVDGGLSASYQECDRAADGNCLLEWNSSFDSPGQHYLQAQIVLTGNQVGGSAPDPTILKGTGMLGLFNSTNICQFDPFYSEFTDSGATLYARTPACPNADYTIELQTTSGAHIKTITGSTSSGEISENWDLTDDNGNTVTNETVNAVFNVTLLDPGSGTLTFPIHHVSSDVWADGNFTIAYAWTSTRRYQAQHSMHDAVQYGAVDTLISPYESGGSGSENPYNSTFNDYSWSGNLNGNPGWLSSPTVVSSLTNNLADPDTRNFYFDGHGSIFSIGDEQSPTNPGSINIMASDVAAMLHNKIGKISWCMHPYRFVFLNACDTATANFWTHAFGIKDRVSYAQASQRGSAQAFMGWFNESRAPDTDDEWNDEAQTYAVFFGAWMSGWPLESCYRTASSPFPQAPFDSFYLNFPFGIDWKWIDYNGPTWIYGPHPLPYHIKIFGYAGITRSGFEYGFDNSPYY